MKRMSIPTLITAVLLLVILTAYMITTQVRFNQVGVRVKLGKASPESVIEKPGLYVRWPWPIETIKTYDARLRTTDTPEAESKTRDGKNLIVSAYAIWRIHNPYQYYVRVAEDAEAIRQLRTRLGQVRSSAIGQHDLSYFVSLDNEQVQNNWQELEQQMLADAAPGVLRDYGIELLEVNIRRISLPEQVTRTVFQAMAKNAERLAARYREEGKSLAEAIRARADAERRQILAFADVKAQEIRSQGLQQQQRLLSQIRPEDQAFYEFLRQMDALRIGLQQKTTIFLDSTSPLHEAMIKPFGTGQDGAAPQSERTPAARQDGAAPAGNAADRSASNGG